MRLLLVEDEPKLLEALEYLLKRNGYAVDTAADGESAMDLAASDVYDLLVLDWMLPGRSGMNIVKELRKNGIDVPVLFLTARDSLEDRVAGLDAGADDYLVKPFSTEELLARLRALWRRKGKNFLGNTIAVNEYTLDPLKGEVTTDTETIRLSFKETQLLEMLMLNHDKVISKERLFERGWGYCSEAEVSNVELYIHYLRKKLDTWRIRTVRGVGYYWQNGEGHVS